MCAKSLCSHSRIPDQTLSHPALTPGDAAGGQVPPVKAFRIELHLGSPDRWDRALTLNLGSEQSGPSFCPLLWPDASRIQRIPQWEWYGVRSQSPSFCRQPVCTVPQVGREAGISQNPPVKAHGGKVSWEVSSPCGFLLWPSVP